MTCPTSVSLLWRRSPRKKWLANNLTPFFCYLIAYLLCSKFSLSLIYSLFPSIISMYTSILSLMQEIPFLVWYIKTFFSYKSFLKDLLGHKVYDCISFVFFWILDYIPICSIMSCTGLLWVACLLVSTSLYFLFIIRNPTWLFCNNFCSMNI